MVTFNEEKDQVTITIDNIEEYFSIRKAMYSVLQCAATNPHGSMNADTLYYYSDLMQRMEPSIDFKTLLLKGIEKGGKDANN